MDTLRGNRQEVWRLALLPDSRTLVSGCKNGAVCLWDSSVAHPRKARIEFPEQLVTWTFAKDGQSVLTFSKQGRVTRWSGSDFQEPEVLTEIEPREEWGNWVCSLSRDGRRLATGSTNGLVQVWDIPQRALWRQWTNTTGFVAACMFLDDGNRLLCHSQADNGFHEWNLETTSEMQSWSSLSDLNAGGISPDEHAFLAIGSGGDVELRNLVEANTTKLGLDIRECGDVSFSGDGRLVAATSYLGFARIWDTSSWREIVTLSGFLNAAGAITFSSDQTRLAVGAAGKDAVKMWDTESWLETLALSGEEPALGSMAFSPDGNAIGSMTTSEKLQVWRAPSWEEINTAEAKTGPQPKLR